MHVSNVKVCKLSLYKIPDHQRGKEQRICKYGETATQTKANKAELHLKPKLNNIFCALSQNYQHLVEKEAFQGK